MANQLHLISYYFGIALIFLVNGFLLFKRYNVYAALNILGGLLIAYYFLNQENYIKW